MKRKEKKAEKRKGVNTKRRNQERGSESLLMLKS